MQTEYFFRILVFAFTFAWQIFGSGHKLVLNYIYFGMFAGYAQAALARYVTVDVL